MTTKADLLQRACMRVRAMAKVLTRDEVAERREPRDASGLWRALREVIESHEGARNLARGLVACQHQVGGVRHRQVGVGGIAGPCVCWRAMVAFSGFPDPNERKGE